jgi:hypothetical protein
MPHTKAATLIAAAALMLPPVGTAGLSASCTPVEELDEAPPSMLLPGPPKKKSRVLSTAKQARASDRQD